MTDTAHMTANQRLRVLKAASRASARSKRQASRQEARQRRAYRQELFGRLNAAAAYRLNRITKSDGWNEQGKLLTFKYGLGSTIIVYVGYVHGWSNSRYDYRADVYLDPRGRIFFQWFVDNDDDWGTSIGFSRCKPHKLKSYQLEMLIDELQH